MGFTLCSGFPVFYGDFTSLLFTHVVCHHVGWNWAERLFLSYWTVWSKFILVWNIF